MRILVIFTFFFWTNLSKAQTSNQLKDQLFELSIENLDLVSLDTKDQIFASKSNGDIYQFSSEGTQLNVFSPARQGRLSQLEAAWTVNIFSFSEDLQEYRILDRFLNTLVEEGFLLSEVNLAKAATLGNNNIIWVWDESDLNLKSIDYLRNIVLQSQPLNLILPMDKLEILEIREFKNRLFMHVADFGILIFDNQGNLIQRVEIDSNQRMCFYKEHLIWLEDQNLMTYSLADRQIDKLAYLPEIDADYIQVGREKLLLIGKDKVWSFLIPNWLKSLK